jgi:gentisate 1,2-dioxygenase
MKKKYFLLSILGTLIVVISFGVGYVYGYAHVLVKTTDMLVVTHADILLTNSITLNRRLKSPDLAKLAAATVENGDALRSFLVNLMPLTEDRKTRKFVEIALTKWEQTKAKLQELRALQPAAPKDNL